MIVFCFLILSLRQRTCPVYEFKIPSAKNIILRLQKITKTFSPMTWYNIRKLENRLAKGEIQENHAYQYLLTLLIFISVVIFFPESPTSYSGFWWDFVEFLIFLIILILAGRNTYKINASGDNRDFTTRFISIASVHGFRLLIWVLIIGLLYKIIMFIIPIQIFNFINELLLPDWTDLIVFTSIFIAYYFFMTRSFRRVNLMV